MYSLQHYLHISAQQYRLGSMRDFFERKDPLLGGQGRITLYFHMFRLHRTQAVSLEFTREELEFFSEEVTAARRKSQRMSTGAIEQLTGDEEDLIAFDREKQSLNDGGALGRQYAIVERYFARLFEVRLPEAD